MSHTVESSFECWAQGVGLSRREREIAALVARGPRNREIASVLGVSPFTVRNELALAFRKAEVTTRAELVNAMHSHGTDEGPAVPRRTGPKGVVDRPWMRSFRTGGTKASQGRTSDASGAEGGGSATSTARQVLVPPGRES
jgi:DNA-binding CsgD family transcriptional regulator